MNPLFNEKIFGSTFSRKHFEEFSPPLDWRECLNYLQKNMPLEFNFLRVGAYWSEIQPTETEYDWTKMDEVITAIEQTGRFGILLSVGMKAPRYPEYYIPSWAMPSQNGENNEISKDQTLVPSQEW